MSQRLEDLSNLGPVTAQWLRDAGIHTPEALKTAGPVEAFLAVRATGQTASLTLLYALAGAIEGVHWTRVDRAGLLLALDARSDRNPLLR